MGRHAKDPDLNSLANVLRHIKMSAAPDLESIADEKFHSWGSSDACPFRFVCQMPNFKTWAIKMYLGGDKRTLGYTDDLTTACRFADMAQMRFWKYRIRGACEPVEADLNFSVEQARNDCANEEKAAALLDNIEQYLKDINAISAVDKVPIRSDRDMRRTVRHDMLSLFVETQNMIKALHVKMDALCTRLNAVELRTPSVDKVVDVTSNAGVEENNLTPIGVNDELPAPGGPIVVTDENAKDLGVEELFAQPKI